MVIYLSGEIEEPVSLDELTPRQPSDFERYA